MQVALFMNESLVSRNFSYMQHDIRTQRYAKRKMKNNNNNNINIWMGRCVDKRIARSFSIAITL